MEGNINNMAEITFVSRIRLAHKSITNRVKEKPSVVSLTNAWRLHRAAVSITCFEGLIGRSDGSNVDIGYSLRCLEVFVANFCDPELKMSEARIIAFSEVVPRILDNLLKRNGENPDQVYAEVAFSQPSYVQDEISDQVRYRA